jgi:SSS family solute:Na+ symporter/sodium/proline symporter
MSLLLMTSFGTWGLPHMIQKYFGIRSDEQAKRGIWISSVFSLLVAGGGYFIGSLCYKFFTRADLDALAAEKGPTFKDYIMPMMLDKANLPAVLLGIVFVLLLAASVSTLCSITLTSSSILVKDFIGTLRPKIPEKKLGLGIKLLCVLFIGISYFVANSKTPILDLMSYSWGIISGSFLAPYVLALYYKGMNKVGAWGGILTGFCIALVPATCKLLTVAGVTAEAVVKLAGQGPQFAVIAAVCSLLMCFALSAAANAAGKGQKEAAAAA